MGSSAEPELLWSSPINTVAMKGSKLKLKCIFSGNPTPEVTWKKILGNELPKKRMRLTSFKQEIQIRRVEFGDQGQYECTVSGNECTVSGDECTVSSEECAVSGNEWSDRKFHIHKSIRSSMCTDRINRIKN